VGAHLCSQRHEERQEGEAVLLPGGVEIVVDQQVGEVGQSSVPEVHRQEGEIVEHVDRRQPLVEVEAVEQPWSALEHADVAQVQIAVTAADATVAGTGVEQGRKTGKRGLECAVEATDLGRVEHAALPEACPVDGEHAFDVGRAALVARDRDRGPGVRLGNLAGQAADHSGRELPSRGDLVQKIVLVEPFHFDNGIDKITGPVERQPAGFAGDAADARIEFGGDWLVQVQLGLASGQTDLGRREIDVRQLY
jgi:hypothetical protein